MSGATDPNANSPEPEALPPAGAAPPGGSDAPAGEPPAGGTPPSATGGAGSEGGGVAGAPPPSEAGAEPQAPPTPDWRERRIAKLTGRAKELEEKLAAAEARAAGAAGLSEADVEARANARAAQLAEQRIFNEQCERVMEGGKAAFGDFDAKVQELLRVVDTKDQKSLAAYVSLIKGAIKTGAAAEIIHTLGSDLNRAQQFLDMDPVDQAFALSKLAGARRAEAAPQAPGGAPPPSVPLTGAPRPVTALGGRGSPADPIDPTDPAKADKLSSREWFARREEQVRSRRT